MTNFFVIVIWKAVVAKFAATAFAFNSLNTFYINISGNMN